MAGFTLTVTRVGGPGRVVSVFPAGAIDCGTTCSSSFDPFTEVTLEDAGDPDTTFQGWVSGCDFVADQDQCIMLMDADKEVVAGYQ